MINFQDFTQAIDAYREILKINELERKDFPLTDIEVQDVRLCTLEFSRNIDTKQFDKMIRDVLRWYKDELLKEMERLGIEFD
jgi:hypothetical protein